MIKYPIYSVDSFKCTELHSAFYANTFTEHLKSHSFIEKPHRHDSHLLVFFTQGSGYHEIDFDQFEIKPGSIFVLQPGQMHHWNLSEDIEGYIFIFSQEKYNLHFGQKNVTDYPFYQSVKNRPDIYLSNQEIKKIVPYFNMIINENELSLAYHLEKILNILDCIHIEISRIYSNTYSHQSHSYNLKLNAFQRCIEDYYMTQKSPSFYADKLSVTLKHLNRICNQILQKTATEVIMDRVILEIKRMLMDRDLAVNEIAIKLGYDDYSYFTRLFRKKTGITPSAFRANKLDVTRK